MSEFVVRFNLRRRLEHAAVMMLFVTLALTGFPQKYPDGPGAQGLVDLMGGLARARWLHRAAGLTFALLTIVHLGSAVVDLLLRRQPFSLVPSRQDFRDVVKNLRYYLGLSEEKAQFDRFDYREKFEYWGMVMGAVVMTFTGLILIYPVVLTRLLPGELVPVAKVAHSNEGLLAFLVVLVWHIYNVHLAPEVFPFNTTIFTGRISVEHLKSEHPLEYARLFPPAPAEPPTAASAEPARPATDVAEDEPAAASG
jgi:cytochrome b subunit of formate dehydrogenase